MKRMLLTAALTLGVATVASAQASDIVIDGTVVGTIESLGINNRPNGTTLMFRVSNTTANDLYYELTDQETGRFSRLSIPPNTSWIQEITFTDAEAGHELEIQATNGSWQPIAQDTTSLIVDSQSSEMPFFFSGDDEYPLMHMLAVETDANTALIESNDTDIEQNASDISGNASDIDANENAIAENTSDIDENETAIASNASSISSITTSVDTAISDINDLASQMEAFSYDIASIGATLEQHEQGIADAMAIGSIQMDPSYSGMQMSLATANYEGTQGMAVAIGGGLGDGAFGFLSFTGSGNYAGSITIQW